MAKKTETENEEVNVNAEDPSTPLRSAQDDRELRAPQDDRELRAPQDDRELRDPQDDMGGYDPWKDMRQVYIPKRTRGEQNTLEVGVNDRTYFIPKEKWVEVPEPVWEVISEMQARQKALDEYLDKNDALTQSQGKA